MSLGRFALDSLLDYSDTLRARADLSDALHELARKHPDEAEQLLSRASDPKEAAKLDEAYGHGIARYIEELLREAKNHQPHRDEPIDLTTAVVNFWRRLRGKVRTGSGGAA